MLNTEHSEKDVKSGYMSQLHTTDCSHTREGHTSQWGQPAEIVTQPVANRRTEMRSQNQWSTEHQSHEWFVVRHVLTTSQRLLNVSVSNYP